MLAVKVFAEGVAEQIKAYLPPEYASVTCSVKEQNKTNGVMQVGIQADMPGHAASPIVYMESFYNEVRSGESMDQIMRNIAEVIQDALDGPALDQSIRIEEFESIKDYLSVMVVNTAENRKLLEQVPHKEVADLSLLCYADLPVDQGGYNATFKITEQMLQKWNVDREELFQIASENTIPANEPVLQNLEEVTRQILIGGAAPENLLKKEFDFSNQEAILLVLTNEKKNFGAAMMFEPKVMDRLSQSFPEGFYILPSSLHEVLILPDRGGILPKELGAMVREVNRSQVEKMEQLSDRVYRYDKEAQKIVEVPESIERGKEMSR